MRGMRIIGVVLAFALLAVCTGCTVYGDKPKPAWDMATSGEQHERLFWDAVKAKNWADVEAHLAGTVVTEAPDAVRNKQQTMEHIRQVSLSDYSIGDVQTETNGGDLIVTYSITVHGTFAGQPLPERPMRMMSVWQPVKRGMVMIAHSSMPVAP
jgi:Domain of unknown function (DUF4440)